MLSYKYSNRQELSPLLSVRKLVSSHRLKGNQNYRLQSQPYDDPIGMCTETALLQPPSVGTNCSLSAFLPFLQLLCFTLPNPILLASLFTHSLSTVGNMTRKEEKRICGRDRTYRNLHLWFYAWRKLFLSRLFLLHMFCNCGLPVNNREGLRAKKKYPIIPVESC